MPFRYKRRTMKAFLLITVGIAVFAASSPTKAAEEASAESAPRCWSAFYAGSSGYAGLGGGLTATASTIETVDDIRKRFGEAGRAIFNIEVKLHRLDGVEVAVASFSWSLRGSRPGVTQSQ